MLVDPEFDEKLQEPTAVINTPESTMEEVDVPPLADEFEEMRDQFMIKHPDHEVAAEAINTWEIKNWRGLPKRTHGPVFEAGGHPWRVLFFPAGNNASDHASFYLEHGFEEGKVPENWYACVQFMLVLWNPEDASIYIHHEANHRFTAEEADWGFTRFAEKNKIFASRYEDRDRPLIENDSAKVTAYVRVLKDPTGVLWHNFTK